VTTWGGAWHPLADRFPLLPEEEVRELAASISQRGQFVPCVMAPDGLGLDGRNRVVACKLAGAEPRWEVYEGDPISFIVEVNADRRHLTTGQRAMAVAIGLVEEGKRKNGRFASGSVPRASSRATSRGNWAQHVSRAGIVLDHAYHLADAVLAGELALDAAWKQAEDERRRTARLEELGPDLAALVQEGMLPLAEAEQRVKEEQRVAALEEDLGTRVREGSLSVDEAEAIAHQRAERFAVWVRQLQEALTLLLPMAGNPLPTEFKEALGEPNYGHLRALLQTLKRRTEKGQRDDEGQG